MRKIIKFNWQNLNERRTARGAPQVYGWPYHGRCWLYVGKFVTRFSWNLWSRFCHFEVGVHDENGLMLSIAIPPISFWFSCSWRYFGRTRTIDVAIHSWAIWWHVWRNWMDGWSRDIPRWRDGSFHPIEFFIGRRKYTERDIEARDILIPMPERSYPAKARLYEATWRRPRWFPERALRVSIDIPGGIPHEGKGENSWDCGVDGVFGLTCPARNIPEAVGQLVGIALHNRVRYGGWHDWEWTKPTGSVGR